jgi:transcriptional regulator with XRE-family HTH domain
MEKVEKRGDFIPAKRLAKLSPGEAVRMLRELHDMTQSDLAQATGIPQPVLSAIENGNATLGLERAKKLARALKVHPAVLLFADWSEEDLSASPVRRRTKSSAA